MYNRSLSPLLGPTRYYTCALCNATWPVVIEENNSNKWKLPENSFNTFPFSEEKKWVYTLLHIPRQCRAEPDTDSCTCFCRGSHCRPTARAASSGWPGPWGIAGGRAWSWAGAQAGWRESGPQSPPRIQWKQKSVTFQCVHIVKFLDLYSGRVVKEERWRRVSSRNLLKIYISSSHIFIVTEYMSASRLKELPQPCQILVGVD